MVKITVFLLCLFEIGCVKMWHLTFINALNYLNIKFRPPSNQKISISHIISDQMKILLSLFFQSVFLLENDEVSSQISKAQRRMERVKQVFYFYFLNVFFRVRFKIKVTLKLKVSLKVRISHWVEVRVRSKAEIKE